MNATLTENPPPVGWREHWEDNGDGKYDETWDGVVIMAPLPNNEHQELQLALCFPLYEVVQLLGLDRVYPGVNVTDRHDDWRQNYRGPRSVGAGTLQTEGMANWFPPAVRPWATACCRPRR